MKTLLLLFTIFILSSCSMMKNKSKEKQQVFYKENTETVTNSDVKIQEKEIKSILDSTTSNTAYKIDKSIRTTSQQFNISNNGKCGDPGILRFVEITDSHGNKTEIPVNDNTDLHFGNESKLESELSDLKLENSTLLKQNDSITKNNEYLESINIEQNKELKAKSVELDLQTKSSPLSAFIWVALLSIAGWELLKFYFKKQTTL